MMTQKKSSSAIIPTLDLGEKLRKIRKVLDIGQEEMAKKLGVHHQTYSRYERGEITPGAELFLKLVTAVNANPIFLLTGEGELFMSLSASGGDAEYAAKGKFPSIGFPARRLEDREYAPIEPLREIGPEVQAGRPVLRLKLLRTSFLMGPELIPENVRFMICTESNFAPNVSPSNVLMLDIADKAITSSYYILRYGADSYALRRLEPIDADTVRVIFGLHNGGIDQTKDMPVDAIRQMIAGRVIWVARKV